MTISSAKRLWQEKLAFLQAEEAKAVVPGQKFELAQDLAEAKAKLAELENDASTQSPRIAPSKLIHVAATLFGRDEEQARLDIAWADPGTHVVTLVAWGGVGKTSLVAKWVAAQAGRDFDGADYFDWSFYSQGTREQGGASADTFVAAALEFFGDPRMAKSAASPWDKGARLAQLVAQQRTLLVLDGLEPLQHPPGPLAGELKDSALTALLRGLAARNPGVCLVTTREQVKDLAPFRDATAPEWRLAHLPTAAGVELLETLGVHGPDRELVRLVEDVAGHALTLNLLGRYLAGAHGGDIRRRDRIDLAKADLKIEGGHAFKTMAAYETRFIEGDQEGARQRAVMRCLGLFDHPADVVSLATLRREPIIADLTEDLVGLDEDDWQLTVFKLREYGFLTLADERRPHDLDAHPLVRSYFGDRLRENSPAAWRAAHGRLRDYFKALAPEHPTTLREMAPLYMAMFHSCQAGEYKGAYDLYWNLIVRERTTFTRRADPSDPDAANAPGTNLGALAHFFSSPWSQPKEALDAKLKLFVLEEAGHYLFLLGQPQEAGFPMHAALDKYIENENWNDACKQARLLREVYLALGDLEEARVQAVKSLELAEDSTVNMHPMATRSGLGQVLYYLGEDAEAFQAFGEAEAFQARMVPKHPRLSFVWGYWYCELLLGQVEVRTPGLGLPGTSTNPGSDILLQELSEIEERARQALDRAKRIFDIAHDLLTLSRVRMLRALLDDTESLERAIRPMNKAVEGLRRTGQQHHLLVGLLSRAALHRIREKFDDAKTDLNEVEEIAGRGAMRLYIADAYIERTRLWMALEEPRQARITFEAAAEIVEDIGYKRREKEMEVLETLLR